MHENISIGTFGLVHNKQMFIISGFIISDPDCSTICTGHIQHNNHDVIIVEVTMTRQDF